MKSTGEMKSLFQPPSETDALKPFPHQSGCRESLWFSTSVGDGTRWKPLRMIETSIKSSSVSSSEAGGKWDEDRVDLDVSMEKDVLWADASDVGDVSKEVLVATRILITAIGHKVVLPKIDYLEVFCSFTTEVQSLRRESEGAARTMADQEAKVG